MKILSCPIILLCLLIIAGCKTNAGEHSNDSSADVTPVKSRPLAFENGKIFEIDGRKMLWGGDQPADHFDISNSELKDPQYHYGIGRERFPALLKPAFQSVQEADEIWENDARFLVATSPKEVKAYSIKDLTRHEVVNDELDGRPIMAVYCILADLGAIYERTYGDHVLTFALSGYTYFDKNVWEGLDGFILWDRDTESLWWPLVGRAVSGPLKGVQLFEMDKTLWKDTTWEQVKSRYPNARVLISGQDYERPASWKKINDFSSIFDYSNRMK